MRSRLATILGAAALVCGLSACDSIQEATNSASNAVDKASLCLEAVELAGFTPDTSNPQQAVENAEQTASDLTALAEKTADTTLQEAFTDMADQIREIPQSLDPTGLASWTQEKVAAAEALGQACL